MKEKKNKISYIKLFARMALIILSFVTSAAFVVALSLLLVCGCGLFIIFSGILMITLFGIVALAVDFDYGCYLFSTLPQVFQMFIACGGLFGLSIILIALAGKIFELILPSPKEAKYEAWEALWATPEYKASVKAKEAMWATSEWKALEEAWRQERS